MAKNNVSSVGSDFSDHLTENLRDPNAAAAYLMVSLDDEDVDYFKVALGNVARAYGIGTVSKVTEIPRATLYNILKKESNPSLATIFEVLDACGLKIAIVPREQSELTDVINAESLPRKQIVKKLLEFIKKHGLTEDVLEAGQKDIENLARNTQRLLQRTRSAMKSYSPRATKKRA